MPAWRVPKESDVADHSKETRRIVMQECISPVLEVYQYHMGARPTKIDVMVSLPSLRVHTSQGVRVLCFDRGGSF